MKIIKNPFLPFSGFTAINLFGILFVREDSTMPEVMINHELIHTQQMKELLFIPFYLLYILEWIFRLIRFCNFYEAYRNISFEKEAYANQNNRNYLKHRKRYSWSKFLWIILWKVDWILSKKIRVLFYALIRTFYTPEN